MDQTFNNISKFKKNKIKFFNLNIKKLTNILF